MITTFSPSPWQGSSYWTILSKWLQARNRQSLSPLLLAPTQGVRTNSATYSAARVCLVFTRFFFLREMFARIWTELQHRRSRMRPHKSEPKSKTSGQNGRGARVAIAHSTTKIPRNPSPQCPTSRKLYTQRHCAKYNQCGREVYGTEPGTVWVQGTSPPAAAMAASPPEPPSSPGGERGKEGCERNDDEEEEQRADDARGRGANKRGRAGGYLAKEWLARRLSACPSLFQSAAVPPEVCTFCN